LDPYRGHERVWQKQQVSTLLQSELLMAKQQHFDQPRHQKIVLQSNMHTQLLYEKEDTTILSKTGVWFGIYVGQNLSRI
jgi:hypothetical protein